MIPGVTFKNLWLVSESSRRARQVELSSSRTLLLGANGTGKSRILKNIFWALGCEPRKRNAGAWDPDTIAALEFTIENEDYTAIRAGRRLGLFDSAGNLCFASGNRSIWMERISERLNYRLTLQRPNSAHFRPAGLSYLTLPYYIDQDGSWGATWNTYADLSQFKNWRSPVLEAFTGLRPVTYLEARQRRTEVSVALTDKQRELEAQRRAFRRVRDELPKNLPSLDLSKFRAELTELANISKKTQHRQVECRAKLISVVSENQRLLAELQLASGAHRELVADLSYLSDIPDSTDIECPTCGTKHKTSFHARLHLASDAESMAALVTELNKRLEGNRENETTLRRELLEIEKSLHKLQVIVEERKARIKLDDVLTAHSKKQIDQTFGRVTENLQKGIDVLQAKHNDLTELVRKYEDRTRMTQVAAYYQAQLRYLSDILDIPADERVDETKIGARPVSGGSSGPRAVLAVHLAMIASNLENGETVRMPFVVDTPQQSGQDESNLRRMIDTISKYAGARHQIVLAVERLPADADVSEFRVLSLEGKQQLLRESEFAFVSDHLRSILRQLKEIPISPEDLTTDDDGLQDNGQLDDGVAKHNG